MTNENRIRDLTVSQATLRKNVRRNVLTQQTKLAAGSFPACESQFVVVCNCAQDLGAKKPHPCRKYPCVLQFLLSFFRRTFCGGDASLYRGGAISLTLVWHWWMLYVPRCVWMKACCLLAAMLLRAIHTLSSCGPHDHILWVDKSGHACVDYGPQPNQHE